MAEIRLWITKQQKFSQSYSDFVGPTQPLGKEGYRYVLNFIDDYSGFIMLYFLKYKPDTLLTIKKYLADIAPYGCVKCL